MGLVPDEMVDAKVGAKYVAKLAASGKQPPTGFLGTPWLLPALSAIGREDLAWALLTPARSTRRGATRWRRAPPRCGSAGTRSCPTAASATSRMNSFNHYAYGAVGDWMYQNIGAIKAVEPGYRKIRVEPNPGGGVTNGKGWLESVYGVISTDWKVAGDDMALAWRCPSAPRPRSCCPAATQSAVLRGWRAARRGGGRPGRGVDDGETVTVTVGSGQLRLRRGRGKAGSASWSRRSTRCGPRSATSPTPVTSTRPTRGELDEGLGAVRDRRSREALLAARRRRTARGRRTACGAALAELR